MFIDLIIETEQTGEMACAFRLNQYGEIVHTKVSISENITIFVAYLRKRSYAFLFGDSVFDQPPPSKIWGNFRACR